MTVGRRIATESLVSTHNSGIMAHQRTVSWSEREYMALHQKVSDMSSEISKNCALSKEEAEK
jgi:hypothetical protein